jgi:hypothetical protein
MDKYDNRPGLFKPSAQLVAPDRLFVERMLDLV